MSEIFFSKCFFPSYFMESERQTAKAKVAQDNLSRGERVFVWCCREGGLQRKQGGGPVRWHLGSSEVLWLGPGLFILRSGCAWQPYSCNGKIIHCKMGCLNHCSVLHSSLEDQEFLRSQGLLVKLRFHLKPIWFSDMLGMFLKCISVPWSGMLSEFSLLSFGDWDIFSSMWEFMINSAFPNLYLEMCIVELISKYVFLKSSVYF